MAVAPAKYLLIPSSKREEKAKKGQPPPLLGELQEIPYNTST